MNSIRTRVASACLRWMPALLLALACTPRPAHGQLQTLETQYLRFVSTSPFQSYLVSHAARSFENAMSFHRRIFNYTPSEKVTILLHDINDYGTGGTNTIPFNFLSLGIEPYDYVYETAPANERMNWVMNHELTHVVATDKAAGSDRFFRSLFMGKVLPTAENPVSMFYSYLTSPRWYCPRWYQEGIATFLETWMSGGIGRALGGYDEMVFRTMVNDSSYFYDFVGLESEGTTIDFQIGANSYLYGTRFVNYLASQYGPGKILEWFDRSDSSDAFFASQFERVYHNSLDNEWSRWIAFEKGWQRGNLDSIHGHPMTPYRPLTKEGLGSVSRAFYDSSRGMFIVGVNYPGQIAHIAGIDLRTGAMQRMCDVPTPALYYVASLAYDPRSGSVFYTTKNSRGWRDINVFRLDDGSSRVLFRNCRTGDLVFDRADSSLWGVRHHNGFSSLMRMPYPYTDQYELIELPYGRDMYDLDVSPDGKYLSGSVIEINGHQRLVRLRTDSLLAGNSAFEDLYEFENNAPSNFVYTDDGRYLIGTSYYTGVSNIFRYDLAGRKMEALSNTDNGFFRPIPYGRDSLIAFRYTGKGFEPVAMPVAPTEDVSAVRYLGQEVVDKYPVVTTWKLPPPNPKLINIDSLTIYKGEYNSFGAIRFASLYPIVEGYKDVPAYGIRGEMMDPVGFQAIDFTGSYSPNRGLSESERFHAAARYRSAFWELALKYNSGDFYDLFGPTKSSRKGYSAELSYNGSIVNERPTVIGYTLSAAGYGGLEVLPEFQNIGTSFDKFFRVAGSISGSYLLRTLGSVDYERGYTGGLYSNATYASTSVYPKVYAKGEIGLPFLVDHSTLWLRASSGVSFGDRSKSLTNFYFGGFGNNWVDYQEIRRFREYYSFPGVELNAIGGANFAKGQLEWTLPPIRFKRFGIPSLYCNWTQITLFTSAISTNLDRPEERARVADVGGQIDWKLVIFSNLESTFSAGYAAAIAEHQRPTDEVMFSLKILR